MASKPFVQVFVDDYATGRLPEVCVVTGHPTTDQVRMRTNVSRLAAIWFVLILFGPVGWLVLLAVSFSSRNYLEGWLPYEHREARRRHQAWKFGLIWSAVAIGGLLLLGAGLKSGIFVVLAVAVLVVGLIALVVSQHREPEIRLDASGRWVTIRRVHPSFAAAIEREYSPADEGRSRR